MSIEGIGNIPVLINNQEVIIKNVNYIPNIKSTLISSKELTKNGWTILFKGAKAIINNKAARMRIFADWVSNAYYININIDYNRLEAVIYRINPVLDSSSLNST
jgi:GR25 family glycosyltransferase involved in LPS biosynthesis